MLFASRALSGLLSSATGATAMAYVGDSTEEEDRSRGIGLLGAAMGLGLIAGPGVGGLLGAMSLTMPFFIGAGLAVVTLLLIVVLVPESLPASARHATSGRVRGAQIREMWRALSSPIGTLLAMLFLVSFGLTNFEAVFGLYSAQQLGYGPERVGTILVVVGIVSAVGKATLIGLLTRWWGECVIVKLSLFASSVGFVLLLLAGRYWTVLLAVGFFILSKTLLRTSLLSLASRRATVGQGVAMGLGNAFISLGRIAGPIWAGYVFDVNTNLPYISGAAIMMAGFTASLVWVRAGESARAPEGAPAR
jgi:DHA1 family multidrug resistance protein-like MFS transporter